MRSLNLCFFIFVLSGLFEVCGYAGCGQNQGNVGAGVAAPRFKDIDQMSRSFQAPMPTRVYPEFSSVSRVYQGYMVPGTFQAKMPNGAEFKR